MYPLLISGLTVLLAAVAQGRYMYAPAVHRSVAQEKVVASWEDARRHCERDGAMLASPMTTELLDHMESYIDVNDHTVAYFIGVRAELDSENREVRYVSVEGSRLEDMPETILNMIEQIDPRDGECLCMDRRSIRAVSCWERLPFICYTNITQNTTTTTPAPTSTATGPSAADLGYTYYPSMMSWYKPHARYETWDEASATCEGEGGYLVVLDDSDEARIISQTMSRIEYGVIWVGLQNERPGEMSEWRSVRGELLSDLWHDWHDGQGYNTKLERVCADLYAGELYDSDCDTTKWYFICERDS